MDHVLHTIVGTVIITFTLWQADFLNIITAITITITI